MKAVFLHIESEAVVTVDCKQIYFDRGCYAVETSCACGYFPISTYAFLGLDSKNIFK